MIFQPEIALALIGGMMFLVGFVLWRSSSMRHRIAKQDPLRDMNREIEARSNSPESLIHDMEVRLFDYGREVEGRIETTLSVLDRLIIDADQEISRLEELLDVTQSNPEEKQRSLSMQKLNANQIERIPDLIAAGLTDAEIARCLNCDQLAVLKYRTQFDGDQKADAA